MEELLLTRNDAQNYIALVNAIHGVKVRGGARSTNHTLKGARKLALLAKQDFQCHDCFKDFKPVSGSYSCATTEHVIPYRYGSSCSKHNVVLLCGDCNNKRNIQDDHEILMEIIEEHFGSIDYSLIPDKPIPTMVIF